MRKADYELLADILKKRLATAQDNRAQFGTTTKESEYWRGAITSTTAIAERFAQSAHVDKTAFLKACGIE